MNGAPEGEELFDQPYFTINKKIFRFLGIWPYQSRMSKYFNRFIAISALLTIQIPQVFGLYQNFGVSFDLFLENIAISIYCLSNGLKVIAVAYYEKEYRQLFEEIIENWAMIDDESEKAILIRHSSRGRLLTIIYVVYCMICLPSFVVLPILPKILDKIYPLDQPRRYLPMLAGEYFVDPVKYYLEIYIHNTVVIFNTCFITQASEPMFAVTIQQCVGLYSIIKYRLLAVKPNMGKSTGKNDDEGTYQHVVGIIKLHQRALSFSDTVASIYTGTYFYIVGFNLLYISVMCILIMINLDDIYRLFRYIILLIAVCNHLFVVMYPGQQLINYSGILFECAYDNQWYETSLRTQKLLQLIMIRSRDPFAIDAGGLVTLNMENFLQVMRSAGSYVTVMASFKST